MASAAPPPALWVKVVPRAPSVVTLDDDYDLLECAALPADVRALKKAVIAARGAKLTGVAPEDLRVYHRGASLPEVDEEAVFLASAHSLAPNRVLRAIIAGLGASPDAFFLVTASLPAGACSRRLRRIAPLAPSSRPPHLARRWRRCGGGSRRARLARCVRGAVSVHPETRATFTGTPPLPQRRRANLPSPQTCCAFSLNLGSSG